MRGTDLQATTESSAQPAPLTQISLSLFEDFNSQVITSMERLSKLSDKRASTVLFTLGSLLIITILGMRLEVFGVSASNLTPGEFVSIVILAGVLLLVAAGLRFYQERANQATSRSLQRTGSEMARETLRVSSEVFQHHADSAIDAGLRPTQLPPPPVGGI